MFSVIKPPVISEGTTKPVLFNLKWLDSETALPPKDWTNPDMDDSSWLRGPITLSPNTSMLAKLCLRGKFTVNYPLNVRSLTLFMKYHGGIIVYLNGEEVGRSHISKNVKGDILAEDYPPEAFVTENNIYLGPEGAHVDGKPGFRLSEESKRRTELWVRSAKIDIPVKNLRKGLNVLAIEVCRSAYDKVLNNVKAKRVNSFPHDFLWPTCYVVDLQLTSPSASGLVLSPSRPTGFQIWNADLLEGDFDLDFGNPAEPLKPVKIVGPRNGSFSGKIHVGSTKPIEDISASIEDLKGPSLIPSSAIKIRYGVPWGGEVLVDETYNKLRPPFLTSPTFMGGLSDKPLKEYPLSGENGNSPPGSVVPVWITVKIPKDAPPGTYTGTLVVKTREKSGTVPVELKVLPWTLPDSQNFRTWVELIQSPDTLSLEYNVPLWSEKHFDLIADSFKLISDTGSRMIYISAISHTNLGNEESMIRWIKKGANKYEWDFSVMDKYLDVVQKYLGNPKIVVLQVWEVYMRSKAQKRFEDFITKGVPQVTFYDPITKKTENGNLPPLSDPSSKSIWKELINQVKDRLKKRGLEKTLMLGMFCDAWPEKEDIEFFLNIAPDLQWVQEGHGLVEKVYDIANVGYNASVWGGFRFGDGCRQTNQKGDPVTESLHGWKRPRIDVVFERAKNLDSYPATRWYFFPETGITSELRGIGRIGADFWRVIKNKDGRRVGFVYERFREGSWEGTSISLNICNPVLFPGAEGPQATNRLIALIEGVQMCEARIYIEEAILKSSIRADLKKRCETALEERLLNMWRALSNLQIHGPGWSNAAGWRWSAGVSGHRYFLSSGWQEQAEKIYTLAGEVQREIEKR